MNNSNYADIERMLDHFAGTSDLDPARLRKRKRILDAATRLFIRQGYRKTTVDEVAMEAGVAKGTVYLYFKTKAELLLHAIIEEKRGYLTQAKPVFDGTIAPEDRLMEWLKLLFTLGVEMPLISRLMSNDREILTALEEFPPGVMKESLAMQSHFIGEMLAQAAGDSEFSEEELVERIRVIQGLMHFIGPLSDERVRGGLSCQRFAEVLVDMLVFGVRQRPSKDEQEQGEGP